MTKILSRLVRYAYIIAQKILFVNHIFRETRFIFVILKNYFCQPVMFDMVTQITHRNSIAAARFRRIKIKGK